ELSAEMSATVPGPTRSISAATLGAGVGPFTQAVDARWLMAYAAGLGETDSRYFDTLASSGPQAHPLFAVCYEWPVAVALREATIDAGLHPLSVHATHHLVIHRAPRAGDTLRTSARVVAIEPRRAGTLVVSRFETVDGRGAPVTTTDYGSVYRGVTLVGAVSAPTRGAPERACVEGPRWTEAVAVDVNAARVYTECARIWNPIHTDVAVARGAGLADPILHGTATLALCLSRVVVRDLGGRAERVREVRARFTGMVALPSSFTVRGGPRRTGTIAFDAIAPDGGPILGQGAVSA
ncbi:MAG TPA: MaoC/PaaZ C-terminal domain-containing protein, partial [Dongiaceae bacterium]|nr:MaoC/PaaZ C-terminal domain-containing protein [Dongiaceae bacterium]